MMGWQIKGALPENVSAAIKRYTEKYGLPESILIEHNPSVKFEDVILPVGMNIITRAWRVVLPSMLLIGETNETSQMGMEVEIKDEMDLERMTNEIKKVQKAQEVSQDR